MGDVAAHVTLPTVPLPQVRSMSFSARVLYLIPSTYALAHSGTQYSSVVSMLTRGLPSSNG